MEEFFVGVLAGVGSAVTAEDLGGVVGGVEADADEVGLIAEGGVGAEGFVDVGEVAGHARAEVGHGAAGVDEGDEDGLALELGEVDDVVALVAEVEVGDGVAGVGDVVLDGGFVVGAGLSGDDDVVELGVAGAGGVLRDYDAGGDAVAGVELAEDHWVLDLVGHGHGVHEAGDGIVVECDVAGVGGDDFAADGEGLFGVFGGGWGGGLTASR